MNRYALLVAAAFAVSFAGGCATTDTKTADGQKASESKDDEYYVTGSRIPRKDKSGAAAIRSAEGQDAQDTLRNVAPMIAPSGGGAK